MKNFNQKLLSASVSMLMTMSICHVVTAQASDIDIYKLPDATKLTIYMMLDTSGSMDANYMEYTYSADGWNIAYQGYSACDIASSDYDGGRAKEGVVVGEISAHGYTRNFCRKGGIKYYYFRKNVITNRGGETTTTWYSCASKATTGTTTTCKTTTSAPSSLEGYVASISSNDTYYYRWENMTKKTYDRISRLKDALYEIATTSEIPNTVKIGVGTYSYNNNNKGYIRINADEWGAPSSISTFGSQRNKLLNLINDMSGSGGTPTAQAYAEAAAALLGTTSGSNGGIGQAQDSSTENISNRTYYKRPVDDTEPMCSGKGIYVLTDGLPSTSSNAASIMQAALTKRGGSTTRYITNFSDFSDKTANGWSEIGDFARSLMREDNLTDFFSSAQNNTKHQVKTAVVGFGSEFDANITNLKKDIADPKTGKVRTYYNCSLFPDSQKDQRNTCYWGNKTKFSNGTTVDNGDNTTNQKSFGEGGFYSASSTDEVITSFKNFVDDMKPEFDPTPTGSPTIPVDALNPIQLQPYGYYATFTPKPQETYQLWLGNLNKYHVRDGRLYDATKQIKLITSTGELDKTAKGIWGAIAANGKDGVLGQLLLGTTADGQSSKRTVYTNRLIDESNQGVEAASLQPVNLTTLISGTGTDGKFKNDPQKNYWLNILGYNVDMNTTYSTVASLPAVERRQLGAVMHSKPVLLTQEGKIVVTDGTLSTTTGRKDYLLFGSTQGSLHVVKVGSDTDTDRGQEVFTFVPHEMMKNQREAFLGESAANGGRDRLFYGIDGAWTAYTQYVSKTDKTWTVSSSGRKDNDGKDLNQTGLQWVYGGLRMGGSSYYALDLTSLTSPSLKFHIDPEHQKIINSSTTTTVAPLSYMGQSWSKPTVAWVNWGGTRKLVMFVGGGYDSTGEIQCGDSTKTDPLATDYDPLNRYNNKGYECPSYNQTNKKGAGVYMFDAGNGDLLWWASANVGANGSSSATTTSGTIANYDANLQYSVVSQINAVDRDGDGLVDHLFFGDLGGQAFRIDLNNKATAQGSFAKHIVRLYNDHQTNGTSPRFYEMPSFSVHSGVNGLFGAVALSSGNRSTPLVGGAATRRTGTVTANDGVYVIYDNDVARNDLYSITNSDLRTSSVTLPTVTFTQLKAGTPQTITTNGTTTYNGGWKYQYHSSAGKYKGMNELYALDSMLYVNVYHKDGTGILGSCNSGVIGDTELYQFCLPTGKCPADFYPNEAGEPNKIILGGGILGTGLGLGHTNKSNEMSIIKGKEGSDCTNADNKNKPECQLFDTGARLQHLRWYESR